MTSRNSVPTIEPVGDEHTDPLPAAAALRAHARQHPTRAPFLEMDEGPHAARAAHLLLVQPTMERDSPPSVPWYRSVF